MNTNDLTRREWVQGILAAGVGALLAGPAAGVAAARAIGGEPETDWVGRLRRGVVALERLHGGRLGVAVLETGSEWQFSYRGDERFAMCSTWKLLAAALVLTRVDRGQEALGRRVHYSRSELVEWSPITSKHAGKHTASGMTIGELCEAALTVSDNTAANLLLASFGGPRAWTAFARSLGDETSRLDKTEPELNRVPPGDVRDTTTPVAMLGDVQKVVLGNGLSPASRRQLTAWLLADKVSAKQLRAGVPRDWKVADKTGSGNGNEANDVGVLWPLHGAPMVVSVYYAGAATYAEREKVIAGVGRVVSGRDEG